MRDPFARCHPATNAVFFLCAIVCTMALQHPLVQAISIAGAMAYLVVLRGRAAWRSVRMLLPLMLIAAALNPLWNHRGATILFYLPTGNPFTGEALLYGLSAACMLGGVLLWCLCLSDVMTADKWTALLGGVAPGLALILSMTLQFVPRFTLRFRDVMQTQAVNGKQKLTDRVKLAVRVLSIVVTWSMYDAIDTADSMKARGYGLPGRTRYAIYHLSLRDALLIFVSLAGTTAVLAALIAGAVGVSFFPRYRLALSPWGAGALACAALLYLCPTILKGWEGLQWFVTQSTH